MVEKLYKPLLTETIQAAVNLDKQRFIGFDGNYCTQGAKALGVSDAEIDAGQFAPVVSLGIVLVKTAGVIDRGSKVASDANGYAIACTDGEENGFALDSSFVSGAVIRIVRGI